MKNNEILIESISPDREYSVVIDEEGDVCYAYLKHNVHMIAHVWIYNRGPAPEKPVWQFRDQEPPFKNSVEFINDISFEPPESASEFVVQWMSWENKGDLIVQIFIDGVVTAEFIDGEKVGRSRLAMRPNMLAIPMLDVNCL